MMRGEADQASPRIRKGDQMYITTMGLIKAPTVARPGHVDEIMEVIQRSGFTVSLAETRILTPAEIRGVYGRHMARDYWARLLWSVSGPVVALALSRADAVLEWRRLIGGPDVEGSIRWAYGRNENSADNAVHGSDTRLEAGRELEVLWPGRRFPALRWPGP
jgi:nucleoside diphosphate kinase